MLKSQKIRLLKRISEHRYCVKRLSSPKEKRKSALYRDKSPISYLVNHLSYKAHSTLNRCALAMLWGVINRIIGLEMIRSPKKIKKRLKAQKIATKIHLEIQNST